MKEDLKEFLNDSIIMLISFAGTLLVSLLAACVISSVWNWFVIVNFPALPVMTIWEWFGIRIFYMVFTMKVTNMRLIKFLSVVDDENPPFEFLSQAWNWRLKFAGFMLIVWFMLWLAHFVI